MEISALVPPAGGGENVNGAHVHPPAGGVEQVKDECIKAETTSKFPHPSLKTANPRVFFDMTVGGKPAGRIVMELFADTTPRTAENFRALCTGEKGMGKFGKPLHYKGSINLWRRIRRRINDHMFCGGDITDGDGSGGESIYGNRFFEDENFIRQHTGPGFISMEGRGPGSSGSLFLIGMREGRHLGMETVVFGQVVEGLDVLKSIAKEVGTPNCVPSKPVVVAHCGQIS
ncbi:PREDICTED: peptidyl-prolyl cis-trans isomerase-like [Camelina sativa]|uniref:Peptidyl-prolyl cis-trans isomerase n=1 Tax=Camelina sativa TaxID=90675 RepID=A0ABM0T449_CAMSA|nr:PREDICTED: peptidyl-prolyl cis-trans isomerase-like [Camelina sativa]